MVRHDNLIISVASIQLREGRGMKEFVVYAKNKPGELARIAEALASRSVNIKAIASENSHPDAFLRIVTNDVNTARKALQQAGFKFQDKEILMVEMPDRPGELAKISKRLARGGVNIESIYLLEKGTVALVVDKMRKAMELLK